MSNKKDCYCSCTIQGSDLIILDEPTTALDPLETEIYEHFNELVKDKLQFIFHRMSSSVFCDKILVLNHGVVEDYLPQAINEKGKPLLQIILHSSTKLSILVLERQISFVFLHLV